MTMTAVRGENSGSTDVECPVAGMVLEMVLGAAGGAAAAAAPVALGYWVAGQVCH